MSVPLDLSLRDVAERLHLGAVTSEELTAAALRRAFESNRSLNAFVSIDEPGARAAAQASDQRRRKGTVLGPLDGVPVALKDMILTEGLVTTAGSKMLKNFVPPYDATVVASLRRAGAVIIGKTNLDEFAMGSSTESGAAGPCRNPYDVTRVPGGSSGGSAAAVAARVVFGALGTDTGGSIRQPAAFCNVVGLKPTYGRVSRHGVVAFASSLDQVGPMARTVGDVAMLLNCIAGRDPNDSTSSDAPVPDARAELEGGVRGLTVGIPREYFVSGMDPEVEQAIRAAAQLYQRLGARVVDISLPHTKYALATYYVLAPSEASSNLARYDGVRYGLRAEASTLREVFVRTRSEGFGAEVKRRIMLGTFALSAGYHDAYYRKAQQVRTLIRRDFEQAFSQVQVVMSAASPVVAWPLGEKLNDPLSMYLMDVLTLPCSLAGLPGLSVPCAFSTRGLPIGLQLLGRPFDELTILRVARALERELEVGARAPPPALEAPGA